AALDRLIPQADGDPGVWRQPEGDTYYRLTLAANLGVPIDPDRAQAAAQAQARVWQDEADNLLRSQGLTAGGVGDRLAALMRDPRYLYTDSDVGKDAAVADMNAHLARVRILLPRAFHGLENTPAQVQRMSPADE